MVNKKLLSPQSRNYIFDLLKIALIFLVVNIHIRNVLHGKVNFLGPYGYYAVPLFMTLSFFLMNKYFSQIKLSFSIILLRIKRLFLPLIFWSAVGFLLKPNLISIKNVFCNFSPVKLLIHPFILFKPIDFPYFDFLAYHLLPTKLRIPLYFVIIIAAFILEYTGFNTRFLILWAMK